MYCKSCGTQMNDNQAICIKCGVKVGDGDSFCQNCGQPINPQAEFCMNCGVSVKPVAKKSQGGTLGGQDKTTMALICFFLGGFGIHNFMMGESKKGILKICATLCFGIGCILALIDFVRILTDSYVVDPEKLI